MANTTINPEADAEIFKASQLSQNLATPHGIAGSLDARQGPSSPPDYEDKTQLAYRLGVSRRTIDSLVATRGIPFVRIGRKIVRFNRRDVDEHLALKNRVAPLR